MAKRELTVREMARMGGKARAAALSDERIAEISRKAGQLGGPARAASLTPKRRSEIARKAAAARWEKKP